MTNLTFEQKYKIIETKDKKFDTQFLFAVKTTKIFCRPSCRAKKPKKENTLFYKTSKQAIQNGFRPCKICKPMEDINSTPDFIKKLIKEVETNPQKKIKDYDLKLQGLEPNTIRRWFKKNHNITFQAYQRMYRINHAFNQINELTTSKIVKNTGFKSISGFNQSWKNLFNSSPKSNENKDIINIKRIDTKLGPIFICATQKGICLLEFTDRKMLETEFKDLKNRLNSIILPGENKHIINAEKQINQYFEKKRTQFNIELDMQGTKFEKNVWENLIKIKYGENLTYKNLSKQLNQPFQKIKNAIGKNKISIIIPCHRMLGENKNLTNYGGGIERKKYLLNLEKEKLNNKNGN